MSIHSTNTNAFVKHVGRVNDKKCAVVLQLPEEPNFVHVIDTEALPNQYHQTLMDMITSPEGQQARWLGDVLHRKVLYDGSNALRTFYQKGYIQQVPVDKVTLTPRPNQHIPLRDVLSQYRNPLADEAQSNLLKHEEQEFNDIIAQEQAKLDEFQTTPVSTSVDAKPNETKHNQHQENLSGDKSEQNAQIAQNLLVEAELLEAEAKRKRAQAAQFAAAKKKN